VRLGATGLIEWEVIGVVGDVQIVALDATAPPAVYLSHLQAPDNRMTLVMRTGIGCRVTHQSAPVDRETLDPGVPVYAVTRLDRQLSESKAIFQRPLSDASVWCLCGCGASR